MSRFDTKITGKAIFIACGCILLSGCVSDTLSTVDTQPQVQPASYNEETPTYDPVQREQAVSEIRAKAAATDSGQLTNAYAGGDGPNEGFTAQEQAEKISQLEVSASQNSNAIPDAELEEKQRSIRELQSKARNHYDNAVSSIQN